MSNDRRERLIRTSNSNRSAASDFTVCSPEENGSDFLKSRGDRLLNVQTFRMPGKCVEPCHRQKTLMPKGLPDRIVAILTKLGQHGYIVRQEPNGYESDKVDCNPDTDPDSDRKVLFLS